MLEQFLRLLRRARIVGQEGKTETNDLSRNTCNDFRPWKHDEAIYVYFLDRSFPPFDDSRRTMIHTPYSSFKLRDSYGAVPGNTAIRTFLSDMNNSLGRERARGSF